MSINTIIPPPDLNQHSSDDEILGLVTHLPRRIARRDAKNDAKSDAKTDARDTAVQNSGARVNVQSSIDFGDDEAGQGTSIDSASDAGIAGANSTAQLEPEHLRAALDANPELREAWQQASAYRETFATPEEARAATALLGDMNRMDELFFSRRPEDHAELARAVSKLDPEAFASLARAMNALTNDADRTRQQAQAQNQNQNQNSNQNINQNQDANQNRARDAANAPTPAQQDFFHSTNAAAVSSVVDAIESQVERLLPEGISKSARNRVVGEIYRELDATLRGNRALGQQMRDAFRSGRLDEEHQRAIVSLVTGRARQALPAVAKRVLNEWTTTVVSANHERRARQRTAERRVDIAGSGGAGNDGRRALSSRDVDYKRMSDADILNL